MIKNKIAFEVKKDERIYAFYCDPECPLGEIFDVMCEMKSAIVQRINSVNIKPEEKTQSADESK
jgi:hypothetical protein